MQVFQAAAHQNYANAHVLEENIRAAADVLPAFQKRNFSLAATAVQFVLGRCGMTPLSDEQMQKGSLLHIPARMEQFKVHGRLVTLDGAHNPQKMAALVSGYKVQQDEAPVVLYSCIEGPDAKIDQTLDELLKLRPQKIILTAFQSMQDLKKLSVEPQLLQAVLARKGYAHTEVIREAHEALRQALSLSAPLVIAGSLYLVFEVRNDLIRLADGQA